MRSMRGFILLLFVSATAVLNADVTIRYKTDFKMGSFLPLGVTQQVSGSPKSPFPRDMVIQIKGDKGYSNAGVTTSVVDFTKQQITLLDATDKLFATVYLKDFPGEIGAAMPALPAIPAAAQKILASMKSNFSVRKTGRTDVILGVQVEESELTLSVEMPVPADLPLPPGMFQPGETVTLMKMVTQIWTATPPEVLRLPALGEFASHSSWTAQLLSPATGIQQMFPNFPGFGEGFAAMMEELSKNKVPTLRSHMQMYMPILARLGGLLQAQGKQLPAGYDGNSPLAEVNSEIVEISSAPIDDSLFQIPSDYRATSLPELLKFLQPAPSAPKPPGTNLPGTP